MTGEKHVVAVASPGNCADGIGAIFTNLLKVGVDTFVVNREIMYRARSISRPVGVRMLIISVKVRGRDR